LRLGRSGRLGLWRLEYRGPRTECAAREAGDFATPSLQPLASYQKSINQKSTVTLNRANRGFKIVVGRKYVEPSVPKSSLNEVPVFELKML
jgi:hypothetical protein